MNILDACSVSLFVYNIHCTCLIKKKEGNVLFNDKLNTFCLRLYDVGHMVKDHSDSHGLLFPISSKGSFICTITDRIAHCGTLAGMRNNSMGPP